MANVRFRTTPNSTEALKTNLKQIKYFIKFKTTQFFWFIPRTVYSYFELKTPLIDDFSQWSFRNVPSENTVNSVVLGLVNLFSR